MLPFRELPGSPAGDARQITSFPPESAGEPQSLVAEFTDDSGRTWVGAFRRGGTQLTRINFHPNGRDIVVIAGGEMWIVDRERRTAQYVWPGAQDAWPVPDPERLVVTDGQSFVCLDARSESWRTRPLTQRAGFDAMHREGERLRGKAWAVQTLSWVPFGIDLRTGTVYDGDNSLDKPFDFGRIAGLEQAPPLSEAAERELAVTRALRRAAFACLLALPVVFVVLVALNRLMPGSMAIFVSGATWTFVFWSTLFFLMVGGVVLMMLTLARACPRCRTGFFFLKGSPRGGPRQSRGAVNVFARRCINCKLPLKGSYDR